MTSPSVSAARRGWGWNPVVRDSPRQGNTTGQLETLLHARTGRSVDGAIRKYDGRPFTPEYILTRVLEEA